MNETIGREEYRQFTKPAELHKAINMLRGIVAGISSSGDVSQSEIEELANWCLLHTALKNRHLLINDTSSFLLFQNNISDHRNEKQSHKQGNNQRRYNRHPDMMPYQFNQEII